MVHEWQNVLTMFLLSSLTTYILSVFVSSTMYKYELNLKFIMNEQFYYYKNIREYNKQSTLPASNKYKYKGQYILVDFRMTRR